jgi:hypothetical protein
MKARAARIAALLGAFAVLYCFAPPKLPVCGFRWLTGRPCPLCGLTRAMFALAKGHWHEAIAFHALSPVVALMLVGLVWDRSLPARFWWIVAGAFGVYGVWRMFVS